ncbi:MAG: tetratricopeptide repeat protein [Afipia sp.]|nr:tetratricopeptide repeat protein [Afipia sp.]
MARVDLNDLFNRGLAAHRAGQLDTAAALYREVLSHSKKQFAPLHLLGVIEGQRGNLTEGIRQISKALRLEPRSAEAHLNLGRLQGEAGDLVNAERNLRKAIAFDPQSSLAHSNLAAVYRRMKLYDQAKAAADQALRINPNEWMALINRGNVFLARNFLDQAKADYERAIALFPSSVEAWTGLANSLLEMKRYQEAIPLLENIVKENLESETFRGRLFVAKMMISDWSHYEKDQAECISAISENPAHATPYDSIIVTQAPGQQLACAIAYTKANIPEVEPVWRGEEYTHDKIRIGYISPDFRDHAIGRVIAGLFEHHDRARFELYAFSTATDQSALRARIKSTFDHFVDINPMGGREVAQYIRDKEIDILIDLAGHTRHSGVNAMAFKPSPVQVTWLGFPGSTGASFMDYIIADPTVIPAEHEPFYLEKVARLPDTYQPNDGDLQVAASPSREDVGLPASGLVFCCFNNTFKITPEVFDIWMRLLGQVEGSVLWLFEGNATAKANLIKEAVARGISSDRLVFAAYADYATYLARTQLADLFLDNNYWNGHSTASDALRCGVPVITCQGTSFASRVASSLLRAIEMPELITTSLEDYEALALKLALDPALLAATKDKLARNRLTAPLFDTARFTRHLEAAYVTMYERAQRGEPPASFAVEALPSKI